MIGATIACAALVIAAFCVGLYIGERGRRHDIAALTGHVAARGGRVTVHETPDAPAEAAALMSQEEREQFIQDLMREAKCSYEQAAAEAERILSRIQHAGADEWPA